MLHSPVTLLVAVASDAASVNLRSHLLNRALWTSVDIPSRIEARCEVHHVKNAWLLYFNQPDIRMTTLDDIDLSFEDWFGVKPNDVVFLSRHTAASNVPALCVHPIGVAADADAIHGGRSGVYVPPSSFLAPLYRALRTRAKGLRCDATGTTFQTCLEATHHGPCLSTPSCFVEIGSGGLQYDQSRPAALWADILNDVLISDQAETENNQNWAQLNPKDKKDSSVVLILGGGHYMPKVGDLCASDKSIFLGHMLASYNFGSIAEAHDQNDDPHPAWQNTIRAALSATRSSYPEANIIVRIEKKAFRSAARKQLIQFLAGDLGIEPVLF